MTRGNHAERTAGDSRFLALPNPDWIVTMVRAIYKSVMFFLVWLAMFAGSIDLQGGTQIVFRETSGARGGLVRLGDVAQIIDSNSEQSRRLEKVVISPAPAAGGELRIPVADIRSRLLAQGFNLAEIDFSGSSIVRISGPAKERTIDRESS